MGGVPDHPTFDLDGLVRQCLDEDLGGIGDVTSEATVPEGARAEGRFVAKESGVLAGVQVAERVFECVDASISRTWNATDGAHVERGDVIGTLEGPARTVLVAERLALNFMQRMSGVARRAEREKARAQATAAHRDAKTMPMMMNMLVTMMMTIMMMM